MGTKWIIKKYIVEEYEVEADTREEASKIEAIDPYQITIKKQTITQSHWKNYKQ